MTHLNLAEIAKRAGISEEEVRSQIEKAKRSMVPLGKQVVVIENHFARLFSVTRLGVGSILTDAGLFHQYDFLLNDVWGKYSLIFAGEVDDDYMPIFRMPESLLIRIDSGCETGQVFGDQTCDCREQLHLTMSVIQMAGEGLIVNIPRQDGRGLGLPFKLATLTLQSKLGLDTVEAAEAVASGGAIDVRTYGGVIGILKFLQVPTTCRITLATNSPDKAKVFVENGFTVVGRTPIRITPTEHTKHHYKAKQTRLGHLGLLDDEP